MKRFILSLLILFGVADNSAAQTITVSGQIRERTEIDNRSLVGGTAPDAFHLLRTRLGATARFDTNLQATIEIQDARAFGTGALNNAGSPALDLRQGFIDITRIAGLPLDVRIGRQSRAYANERLIGRGDWTNTGQSFDAVVARIGDAGASVDLIGAGIQRRTNTPEYRRDHVLAGAWGTVGTLLPGTSLQGFYLFDNPFRDSIRQERQTTGLYTKGGAGPVDFEVEGTYQFGTYRTEGETASEKSIAAWMGGARLGYTFADLDSLRLGAGYDRLSGNDPAEPTRHGSFSNLYGTHHRFYGNMDYLVNHPTTTRALGLEQMIAQLSMVPFAGLRLGASYHLFNLAVDPLEAVPSLPATTSRRIGHELDLTFGYQASKALNVSGGFSIFDGDPDRYILTGRKTTRWGFLMITAGF